MTSWARDVNNQDRNKTLVRLESETKSLGITSQSAHYSHFGDNFYIPDDPITVSKHL